MNFWTGIIIGLFAGANIGVIVAGLLVSMKRDEYADIYESDQFPMDVAALDDVIHRSNQSMGIPFSRSC